jgi:hypothetical protein
MPEAPIPDLLFCEDAMPVAGRWRAGLPGALAVLCLIALATGVTNGNVREQLGGVLVGTAAAAVVFAVLWWVGRRSLRRVVQVRHEAGSTRVRLDGAPELRSPLAVEFGWFPERMEAGVVAATVAVLWLVVRGQGGILVFRKALGAAFSPPPDWPQRACPLAPTHVLLSIEKLRPVLERAAGGATRQ